MMTIVDILACNIEILRYGTFNRVYISSLQEWEAIILLLWWDHDIAHEGFLFSETLVLFYLVQELSTYPQNTG